jgi:hypothetical protein
MKETLQDLDESGDGSVTQIRPQSKSLGIETFNLNLISKVRGCFNKLSLLLLSFDIHSKKHLRYRRCFR